MAWLDDRIRDHPKFIGLPGRAFRDWVFALCYCSEHGTRGNLDAAIQALRIPKSVTAELVRRGVWEDRDDGLWIHDWDAHNLKRDQARAEKRSFDRRRQQLFRDPELRSIVRERDLALCRYCGVEVNWTDRRGGTGATYDHVDPTGPNSVENLVVCCRSCNSQKSGRTPEQAGMILLLVPTQPSSEPKAGLRSEPRSGFKSKPSSEPGYEPSDTPRARAGDRLNDHDHDQELNPRAVTEPQDDEPDLPTNGQPPHHTIQTEITKSLAIAKPNR